MKVTKLSEKVYKTDLLLLYDCHGTEAEDYLKKHKITAHLSRCTGMTGAYTVKKPNDGENIKYFMYIEKDKDQLQSMVHEVAHLVFMALLDCGIKVTQETDEIFAYYFDWWFKKIHKFIK